jgi:hypothetical protein
MLSTMHLGSVLVGIVIGLVLGVLIGWSLSSRRQAQRSDDLQAPLPRPEAAAIPTFSPRAALLFAGASPEASEATLALALRAASGPQPPPPEPHPDQSLMEALRAASRRLNDDTQTRLSRESPDVPPEPVSGPAAVSAASQSSGQHLLELSRRLSEDTARRLARDAEPEST